jgi:hypothetical protein
LTAVASAAVAVLAEIVVLAVIAVMILVLSLLQSDKPKIITPSSARTESIGDDLGLAVVVEP